jgi:hypothetical protein
MMGKAQWAPLVILLVVTGSLGSIGACQAADWEMSFYAGRMTTEVWEDTLSKNVGFADAGIVVVAGAWTFKRYFKDALSLQVEAQVGKYFGDQDNWEFNMPVLAFRWERFPWQRYLATTFAWGIGPSYATQIPEVEVAVKGASEQWLVYWFGEVTFGPPEADWALLLRLHHRSGAFGIVADHGGSNTLSAGFKVYF